MCEKNWEVGSISFVGHEEILWKLNRFLNFCINSDNRDRFLVCSRKNPLEKCFFLPEYFVIDNSSHFIFNYCLYNRFLPFCPLEK